MTQVSIILSVITLYVNGLNWQSKDRDWQFMQIETNRE